MMQELTSLRHQRDTLSSVAETTRGRLAELENALAAKEKAVGELKGALDRMRQHKIESDEASERRYQVLSG